MSEHRPKNRRTLDIDSDEDDDTSDEEDQYWAGRSHENAARRFLWDEDVPDPGPSPLVLGKKKISMASTVEVNLMDDSFSDRVGDIDKPKRSLLDTSTLATTYDADPAYDDDDDASVSKQSRRRSGSFSAACRNCYHTLLGGCGMCVETLCSARFLFLFLVAIVFVGIASGITYLLQNMVVEDEYPVSEEFRGEEIIVILEQDPYINTDNFRVKDSDQEKALQWFVNGDTFRGSDHIPHRYALAAFYFGVYREAGSWKNNEDWLSDKSFCFWHGVECVEGRIVGLSLVENGLKGPLHPEIGALHTLAALDLHKNHLSGSIPTDMANLESLAELNLMDNKLSGPVPVLGTSLRELNLGKNLLDGVEDLNGFASLEELKALGLQKNSLAGPFSDLKFPSTLEILYLDHNQLNGTLPDSLYGLTELKELRLDKNLLSGTISVQLARLSELVMLTLDINQFEGNFPDVFGNLPNLEQLFLVGNAFTGSLPPSLATLENLEELFLGENSFTGFLPAGMEAMTSMRKIYLHDNQLVGTLPDVFNGMPGLSLLKIEKNLFSGTLPPSLASCTQLGEFVVGQNAFSGQIPTELGALEVLKTMNLENNKFTGVVPTEVCTLVEGGSLAFLSADCNQADRVACDCCHLCY